MGIVCAYTGIRNAQPIVPILVSFWCLVYPGPVSGSGVTFVSGGFWPWTSNSLVSGLPSPVTGVWWTLALDSRFFGVWFTFLLTPAEVPQILY